MPTKTRKTAAATTDTAPVTSSVTPEPTPTVAAIATPETPAIVTTTESAPVGVTPAASVSVVIPEARRRVFEKFHGVSVAALMSHPAGQDYVRHDENGKTTDRAPLTPKDVIRVQ